MEEASLPAEPRPFPPCPHYRVYADGRIESCLARGYRGGPTDRWRPIKPWPDKDGYLMFQTRIGGKRRVFLVHRAVLLTFVGPCPEGMRARHLDGDRANDRLDNLCWGTRQENTEDKLRHGTVPRGERHPAARLTDAQREAIRLEHATLGTPKTELGRRYGVSGPAIGHIINGRPSQRWAVAAA
jgi:hypothetical protein